MVCCSGLKRPPGSGGTVTLTRPWPTECSTLPRQGQTDWSPNTFLKSDRVEMDWRTWISGTFACGLPAVLPEISGRVVQLEIRPHSIRQRSRGIKRTGLAISRPFWFCIRHCERNADSPYQAHGTRAQGRQDQPEGEEESHVKAMLDPWMRVATGKLWRGRGFPGGRRVILSPP